MTSPRERANAIRFLAIDAVQKAQSGHPGMPMGMADIAEVLWHDFLKHDPQNTSWWNRDRFILSNGHGSMLLYALLHLTGYDLSINDLKAFRQLHSKTAGHPEIHITPGVETTTGPLGQGLANAIGMALAEKILASRYNQPNFNIIDHHTYVFLGDGCLMEGISHEVCSLAGTWKLNKLIAFWDDNHISIDGDTAGWFTDNTAMRFKSYGWNVIENVDGHDHHAIHQAIISAQQSNDNPTLIACRTQIGFGAPGVAGTAKVHGSPLGNEIIAKTRETLQWPHAPFEIPKVIYESWDAREKGNIASSQWNTLWDQYQKQYPELAKKLSAQMQSDQTLNITKAIDALLAGTPEKPIATRVASQQCLETLGEHIPGLLGGSADLTGSNGTRWSNAKTITSTEFTGNYLYYGVREFGMFAIMNGLALHGGFIPYGGTFLTFVDYGRNAVRMAALMQQRIIFVLTHDSIGLGEDGPTHQPVEHAAMLRLTPNVSVWRPCDHTETIMAWQHALLNTTGPTCLLLSRQNLTPQTRTPEQINHIQQGGYILWESTPTPDVIFIATGSELDIAIQAAQSLQNKNISVRVVSMPSCDTFDRQEQAYRDHVLPPHITKRIAVEAGIADYWYRYVGLNGKIIGLHDYGLSGTIDDIYAALGITVDNIINEASIF